MFIEKRDRTIRTLYNQRGGVGFFFSLVKIKALRSYDDSSLLSQLVSPAEVDSDIT